MNVYLSDVWRTALRVYSMHLHLVSYKACEAW